MGNFKEVKRRNLNCLNNKVKNIKEKRYNMMKKFKKEIIAIVSGMAFSYAWQLFGILMCYILAPNSNFITREMFIPVSTIQLAATPMVAWILMGLLKVRWFKKWLRITMCGLAFLIPFMLIAGITVIVAPILWWKTLYWLANVGISALLAFTMFKPLLQYGTKSA